MHNMTVNTMNKCRSKQRIDQKTNLKASNEGKREEMERGNTHCAEAQSQ